MFQLERVQPDPAFKAEVVILLTTLRAKRTEFNAGKRIKDFFEVKRAHFKAIDFNRDARLAGTGEIENQAIQKLLKRGELRTAENDELILPQIFIDGQYIGGIDELQGYEDEGTLDKILMRQDKSWKVEEILPGLMTIDAALQDLARHTAGGESEDDDDYDDYDDYEREE